MAAQSNREGATWIPYPSAPEWMQHASVPISNCLPRGFHGSGLSKDPATLLPSYALDDLLALHLVLLL
eukprot:3981276-Prymnesium_polylepis.1